VLKSRGLNPVLTPDFVYLTHMKAAIDADAHRNQATTKLFDNRTVKVNTTVIITELKSFLFSLLRLELT
jgi:hypothetical protein